jgi:tRNA pseudouridine13 synthase
MYVLKHSPEDFVVEEIPALSLDEKGAYLILRVTKRGRNTEEAAERLAHLSGVGRKDVGYAGNKDRNAVTTQFFSVRTGRNDAGRGHPDLMVSVVGRSRVPLTLGALEGNRFVIVVRNL